MKDPQQARNPESQAFLPRGRDDRARPGLPGRPVRTLIDDQAANRIGPSSTQRTRAGKGARAGECRVGRTPPRPALERGPAHRRPRAIRWASPRCFAARPTLRQTSGLLEHSRRPFVAPRLAMLLMRYAGWRCKTGRHDILDGLEEGQALIEFEPAPAAPGNRSGRSLRGRDRIAVPHRDEGNGRVGRASERRGPTVVDATSFPDSGIPSSRPGRRSSLVLDFRIESRCKQSKTGK